MPCSQGSSPYSRISYVRRAAFETWRSDAAHDRNKRNLIALIIAAADPISRCISTRSQQMSAHTHTQLNHESRSMHSLEVELPRPVHCCPELLSPITLPHASSTNTAYGSTTVRANTLSQLCLADDCFPSQATIRYLSVCRKVVHPRCEAPLFFVHKIETLALR